MARKNCYRCPKNMAHQCNLDFGLDGCPPCADTAESAPSASTNTGSPKLPTREQFISWLATFESAPTAMSVYEWLCRQLRASA